MGGDPVGANPASIHLQNRYAYANNNPYKYGDPDGRLPVFLAPLAWNVGRFIVTEAVAMAVEAYAPVDIPLSKKGLLQKAVRDGIKDLPGGVAKGGLGATKVTRKGIARVERHLTQTPGIEAGPAEFKMIERLKAGNRTSQDLRFYQHEIIESRMINKTRGLYTDPVDAARDAHHRTLIKQGLYRRGYQNELYHTDALKLGD